MGGPRGAGLGRGPGRGGRIGRGPRGAIPGVIGFRGMRLGLWRGARIIFWGGVLHRLLAVDELEPVYFGTEPYYGYGYVAAPRPYCTGVSEEGCALAWRDVRAEDGTVVPQCVQYCRRGVTPSVVSAAQQAPPPSGNEQGCEMKGFAEPNLQGQSFTTGDNYPAMDEWKQQVQSLQVVSGTWDFYSDDNYGGEVIRLGPGAYRTLGENWTSAISSFMCSEPGGGEGGGAQAPAPQ
ncbi:MAG: beta/gamma crystallin family protein [Variibacter sp.]|nr:beta/gamma crystallin family protein [Variibacter sp.]